MNRGLQAGIGGLLVLSGFVYAALWIIQGGTWAGPLSLRKPILFGVSTGITLLSVARVCGGVRARLGDRWLYGGMAVALLFEVALIDLQQARGVASHFNRETAFDAGIANLMGLLILFATLCFVDLTIRLHGQSSFPPDEALASRAGMVFLVLACLLGIGITAIGEVAMDAGRRPETWGQAGVLKFAHGVPIHAIQAFQLQLWILRRWRIPQSERLRSLWASTWAAGAFTLYGVLQTGLGEARFPPTPWTWPWLLVAMLASVRALLAFRRVR
ncbi:MAG: hypothetical protein AAGD10_10160 [Myxococcota bacterium]